MKWLVKKLDSLSLQIPSEDAKYEQQKLESLVSRYKSLIQKMDASVQNADVNTKCHQYRDDVNVVIKTLDEVAKHCDGRKTPDTLQNYGLCIKDQTTIVKQLDAQRDKIFETLQKGKNLSKDVKAPLFV